MEPGHITTTAAEAHSAASLAAQRRADFVRLVRLSVSLGAVQMGYALMGFVDTAVAGRAGGEVIAAAGLGASLFFAITILGIGIGLGIDPMVAQALGAQRPNDARRALWHGVYVGVALSAPLAVVLLALAELLPYFGIAPALAHDTRAYVLGRVASLPFLLAGVAVRGYLQAQHVSRPVLWSVALANVVNLVANWLLLFGDAGLAMLGLPAVGLPALGVFGIGVASTVATVVQLAAMIPAARKLAPPGGEPVHRFSKAIFTRLLSLGTPFGFQMLAEVGVFAMVSMLMGRMGSGAMAAHQVALMIASLTFSFCVGIGAATSVEVGRAIGRGDAQATRRAGLGGIYFGAAFMLLPSVVMAVAPESIARLMTDDPLVLPAAAALLRIAAVFQVADGVQAVATGALRGAGLTRWSFVANLVAHWLIGLPAALGLAFGLGLGPAGLWWGLTAGLVAVALALALKFGAASRGRIATVLEWS